jgi:hypothetical protein
MSFAKHTSGRVATVLALALIPAMLLMAGERRTKKAKPSTEPAVDMFDAIDSGDLEVKFIPKNADEARVIFTNNGKKPLNVRLPEAFAGVPVLAQLGGGGQQGGQQNQGTGGGFGGGGQQGGGGGGGFFNVPAEKVAQLKVPTVCLEHGKKEPRANIPYQIKPIESFTKNVEVQELCKLLGSGQLNQRAAQAAAWHLANGMSWEQLASKKIEHLNAPSEPYFSQQEIRAAMQISEVAVAQAKLRPAKSPGESSSLSQK